MRAFNKGPPPRHETLGTSAVVLNGMSDPAVVLLSSLNPSPIFSAGNLLRPTHITRISGTVG